MRVIKIAPADSRHATRVTLQMSTAEADALLKALAAGELAELGISAVIPADDKTKSWCQRHKHNRSPEKNSHPRRRS